MYPPAHPSAVRSLTHHLSVVAATLFCLGSTLSAESRLPGIQTATLDAALKGRLLLEELNCVACHAAPAGTDLKSKQAPRLAEVAQRVHPTYLEKYIGAPHTTKPGSTMPDLLAKLPEAERATAAKELTHFLLSLKASTFAPQAPDAVAAAPGEKLFHARGCAACHSPRDAQGRETLAAKSVPLGALEDKYSLRSLIEFLRQPHLSRPSGRMPDLKLPARELESIAHYLLRNTRVPGHLNYTMYRGQVWEGIGHEAVEPERAGQTADFALSNFDRVHHHMALRFEGWINLKADGDYQFFLKANGATLTINGKEVAALAPKDRRGVQAFEGREQIGVGQFRRALALGQRLQLQGLLPVEGAGRETQHALVAGAGDVDLAQQDLAKRQRLAVVGHDLLTRGADAIEHGLNQLLESSLRMLSSLLPSS